MNRNLTRLLATLTLGLGLVSATPRAVAQDGIYADFTTSMGSFTCRLEYALAPKASANFIALATGQRPWLDEATGHVRTNAFFDGITFHRVIADFMNQSGSRNGQGSDGPGYVFQDQFSPSLRHDSFGVLSMANNGTNSNGSQFFITATNTPWLDNVHTVFGKVVGGSNVVRAINRVATDASDNPLTNVVLQKVGIRRVGTAALAFDIHAQGLPGVSSLTARIARRSGGVTLSFSNRLYTANHLFSSTNLTNPTNLTNWAGTDLGLEVAAPLSNSVARTATAPREFFRFVQVQYPGPLFVPRNLSGRTLVLSFGTGGVLTINFDSTGRGTYTWPTQNMSGAVTGYNFNQMPYRGEIYPVYLGTEDLMTMNLSFTSLTGGTVTGTNYYWDDLYYQWLWWADQAGTFTLSP